MNSKIKDPLIDGLFEAILLLESTEECYNFSRTYALFRRLRQCPRDWKWQKC